MRLRIADWGIFLSTRPRGREVRASLDEAVNGLSAGDGLIVDFTGVDAMTFSFADEVVGTLVSDRAAGRYLDYGLAVVGFNPDVRETLELVMHRRRQAVFGLLDDGEPTVLGAEPWLAETVKRAVELGSFRAAELAEALGLTAQAVNNRLKAAQAAGAVTRERVVPEGGGKEFLYRAAIPVHA